MAGQKSAWLRLCRDGGPSGRGGRSEGAAGQGALWNACQHSDGEGEGREEEP